ncbi:hypothetical protein INT46_008379 [Mucor plumbeus]|uniref:Uncharacterized protein n=1 Tax=Mucor plumbeus TaxID=97098 RepID=A0A8H7UUN8_9FUNG|nr:hypothetical protein INT46_008379 [Mucor plumbeus]
MQGQLKSREREEKEKRRDGEIQGAKANLKHKGQMLMYNAADCSFYEINANLERDKGKRKATTANEEEDSEDEGSVGQKNLSNEDKDDRGNGKKLRQESPFDIEENKDVSFVTTTSGGSFQDPVSSINSPYIAYVASLDEIEPLLLENLGEIHYMSESEPQYIPDTLDDDTRSLVDKFSRAVRYKHDNFLLSPLKPELVNITILLLPCHSNILKEYKIQQLNSHLYKPMEDKDNRETDYQIKFVVPFHRQTSDAKFVEIGSLGFGAVEIEPFHTAAASIDNDILRLGKISKRMLHRRVMKAKSPREFMTFGVMVGGSVVEYYIHQYHLPSPSTAAISSSSSPSYTFKLVQKCMLPTLSNSLTRGSDIDKPYLYSPIDCIFAPTVTLLTLY